MAGRGVPNFATRSGRGGTTGRAAGCPASGRAPTRGREPPVAPEDAPGAIVPAGITCPAVERRGATGTGRAAGAPGPAARAVSVEPAGIGWRGPESIWPGFGEGAAAAGSGLAAGVRPGAITPAGGVGADAGAARGPSGRGGAAPGPPATGGWMGFPVASGGRIGTATPGVTLCSSTEGLASCVAGCCGVTPGPASGCADTSSAGAADGAVLAGSGAVSPPASSSGTSNPYSRRSLIATSSSIELEWVFFSVTPSSGSRSKIS